MIFYELLTGHHPDEPSTTSSDPPPVPKRACACLVRPHRVHSIGPSVPRAQKICTRAMATDPEASSPTARALADEVDSMDRA